MEFHFGDAERRVTFDFRHGFIALKIPQFDTPIEGTRGEIDPSRILR